MIEVNKIVRLNNCIFQPIQHANDLGIDAFIEFVENERPVNKIIAVQIKTGDSYFYRNGDSKIPIEKHYEYWSNYPLPVFGITCKVSRETGHCELFWVDITTFLKNNHAKITSGKLSSIRYSSNELSRFDMSTFSRIFLPYVVDRIPDISYSEAVALFHSGDREGVELGLQVLFNRYFRRREVWDSFLDFFRSRTIRSIPSSLVYVLSHIPGHPDLWWNFEIPTSTREYAKEKMRMFTKSDIIKLLFFVDDAGIARGALGQCVEAIISTADNFLLHLERIISDGSLPLEIRQTATWIYSYHRGYDSVDFLRTITDLEGVSSLIASIQAVGHFDFY